MNKLNEIQAQLENVLAENKQEIQGYEIKIQGAKDSLKQAEFDLMDAEETVDVERYRKAKDDIWASKSKRELFTKKLEKEKNKQLISSEEYKKLLSDIRQTATAEHEKQNKRAEALIAELKEIAEESRQTNQQANELMHLLQRDVFKESEGRIQTAEGGTTWSSDQKYEYHEAVHHVYGKLKGSYLSKRVGETQQTESNYWG